jgi:hypothetical protein
VLKSRSTARASPSRPSSSTASYRGGGSLPERDTTGDDASGALESAHLALDLVLRTVHGGEVVENRLEEVEEALEALDIRDLPGTLEVEQVDLGRIRAPQQAPVFADAEADLSGLLPEQIPNAFVPEEVAHTVGPGALHHESTIDRGMPNVEILQQDQFLGQPTEATGVINEKLEVAQIDERRPHPCAGRTVHGVEGDDGVAVFQLNDVGALMSSG